MATAAKRLEDKVSELYIGLMSGTSADGVDAVIVDFASDNPRIIAAAEFPLADTIKQTIIGLAAPSHNEIDIVGELDRKLGILFSGYVNKLLTDNGLKSTDIKAIGSHGQTVRHRPADTAKPYLQAFTLQIGDPNTIAELTGITTVADFRRRDIAAGGQGAPLVPAFHQAIFSSIGKRRAVINIGGMANVTILACDGSVIGYDTGPGNVLMDGWIYRHQAKSYDRNGDWAASGTCNQQLLDALLTHPFFAKLAPKSTGREDFNLAWLDSLLVNITIAPEDVQATLLRLTAITINSELAKQESVNEIVICGGGAFNGELMTRLEAFTHPIPVKTTTSVGVAPEWVEGCAFAWLAKRCIEGLPGNCPAVTGAHKQVVLGTICHA
jgi:anhydro-N-acetylmuramic acid kinase